MPEPPGSPKTWRKVSQPKSFGIRDLLLKSGGVEDQELTGNAELWRVRLGRAVFTGYGTGTIYCNGVREPELLFVYGRISSLLEGL